VVARTYGAGLKVPSLVGHRIRASSEAQEHRQATVDGDELIVRHAPQRRSRARSRRMLVILSIITQHGAARGSAVLGDMGTRNRGASRSGLVSGQTTSDRERSNASACTTTAGRGLPA
jgi:hypothetical protein